MPVLSYIHHLFSVDQCQDSTSIHCGGKIAHSNAPAVRATTLIRGASITTVPAANATGAMAASAPSTISPIPCSIKASGRSHTGYWRHFCSASPAHHDALPESWASISGPAIAGVGGCGMPPCPMRCTANWRGLLKRMNSITPLGRRAKPSTAGRSAWDAEPVVAARNTNPVGDTTTRTGPRSSPESVARGLSSSRRPAISP
jgi:hypothetical protein